MNESGRAPSNQSDPLSGTLLLVLLSVFSLGFFGAQRWNERRFERLPMVVEKGKVAPFPRTSPWTKLASPSPAPPPTARSIQVRYHPHWFVQHPSQHPALEQAPPSDRRTLIASAVAASDVQAILKTANSSNKNPPLALTYERAFEFVGPSEDWSLTTQAQAVVEILEADGSVESYGDPSAPIGSTEFRVKGVPGWYRLRVYLLVGADQAESARFSLTRKIPASQRAKSGALLGG